MITYILHIKLDCSLYISKC